jgi:hypothetical protein
MKRRSPPGRHRAAHPDPVPHDFRERLELTRLHLRALFRTLDQLHLAQELPAALRELFERDADYAEALWVLDQPAARFNRFAMVQDTLASLATLPEALFQFLTSRPLAELTAIEQEYPAVRATLTAADAYQDIPGRDPTAPAPLA